MLLPLDTFLAEYNKVLKLVNRESSPCQKVLVVVAFAHFFGRGQGHWYAALVFLAAAALIPIWFGVLWGMKAMVAFSSRAD